MELIMRSLFKLLVAIVGICVTPNYLMAQATSLTGDTIYEQNKEALKKQIKVEFTSKLISEKNYWTIKEDLAQLKKEKSVNKNIPLKFNIGDEKDFFVRDVLNGNNWLTKSGELVLSTNTVNIWVESEPYEGVSLKSEFNDFLLEAQTKLFESTDSSSINPSVGILEILTTYVGEFPNVDGDHVLDIFFLDIEDNFNETGGFVAGFFDPVNLIDHEFSNQSDLIYIDLFPTLFFEEEVFTDRTLSTLAHEAQHLIHAGYEGDEPEIVFANEGFSEAVEILSGFTPRSSRSHLENPLRTLTSWNYSNPIPDYSRASLWTHYLLEQFGSEILQELVQNPTTGIDAYEEVLKKHNASFLEVFQNWGIALSINNPLLGTQFGYQHPLRKELIFDPLYSSNRIPDVIDGKVPGLTHSLFSFPLAKELSMKSFSEKESLSFTSFSSYPEIEVTEIDFNFEEGTTIEASRQPHGSISFLVSNVENQEIDSTFTSVNLKIEGKKAGVQQKWEYGDGINDAFYLNASYLSLDSFDEKLGIIFSSNRLTYWLESFSLKSVYLSELSGTGISGEEERDFEFAIYSFRDGKIDQEIVAPQRIVQSREVGKLIVETIPLTNHYSTLSALTDSIMVVIGNDNDDENFIALGMDKSEFNNTHYSENGEWESLSTKSIGGNSLAGWNPIVQANVVIDQRKEEFRSMIEEIDYDFESVTVKLNPFFSHDSTSISLIAEMPNGGFQKGKLILSELEGYLFEVPVQVNGTYSFITSVTSQNGEQLFRDEKEWEIEIPDGFLVSNNFPNPFNPTTTIPFTIIESALVGWEIFDVLGRKVLDIPSAFYPSGEHVQVFELRNLASGMYVIRGVLKRDSNNKTVLRTKKVMLIK